MTHQLNAASYVSGRGGMRLGIIRIAHGPPLRRKGQGIQYFARQVDFARLRAKQENLAGQVQFIEDACRNIPTTLLIISTMDLGLHAIVRPEELSGQRHQLSVGWVIECLDSRNAFEKLGMGALDVRRELVLGTRRSCDQDCARAREGLRNALQEVMIHGRVTTTSGIGFMMDVLMRMRAVNDCTIYLARVELKHLSFVVVDPNQGVIVLAHDSSLSKTSDTFRPATLRTREHRVKYPTATDASNIRTST